MPGMRNNQMPAIVSGSCTGHLVSLMLMTTGGGGGCEGGREGSGATMSEWVGLPYGRECITQNWKEGVPTKTGMGMYQAGLE